MNREERFVSPLQHQWIPLKEQIGRNTKYKNLECTDKLLKDSFKPQSRKITYDINERATNKKSHKCIEERTCEKHRSLIEITASKPMDRCPE